MTDIQPGPTVLLVAEWTPPGGHAHEVRISTEQLNAKACIECGGAEGELAPAGHVHREIRPGQPLGYAVVAHLHHLRAAS